MMEARAVRFQRGGVLGGPFSRGDCPWLGLRSAFGAEYGRIFEPCDFMVFAGLWRGMRSHFRAVRLHGVRRPLARNAVAFSCSCVVIVLGTR